MDALPTLSVDGFTTNKSIIMTDLYEYFLASDYSQSNTFYGNIASMKYIVSEAKDSNDLRNMVIEALTEMYTRYYNTVTVDAIIDETDNRINIKVNIIAVDADGISYSLSKIVGVVDNKILTFDNEEENINV